MSGVSFGMDVSRVFRGAARPTRVIVLGVLFLGLAPSVLRAQACAQGEISVVTSETLDPFLPAATSPGASFGWIFRALNVLHVRSRPSTVGRELLFQEGDCFDLRLVRETERVLRSLPFISTARVDMEELPDGRHRIEVHTRDAWALLFGMSFSLGGGLEVTGASVSARNVLGTGTRLGFFRNEFRSRRRVGVIVRQTNLFGTHVDGTIHGGRTRAGDYYTQSFLRPFVGERGTYAFRQSAHRRDDYFEYSGRPGSEVTQRLLRFEAERYEATYQRRFGDAAAARLVTGIGISREIVRFSGDGATGRLVVDNAFDDPVDAPPGSLDEVSGQTRDHDADRINLMLGVRDVGFVTRSGLDAVRAVQDEQVGPELTAVVAPSIRGERTDVLVQAQGSWGFASESSFLRVDGEVHARRLASSDPTEPSARWRDVLYEVVGRGYWSHSQNAALFTSVAYVAGSAMDRPFQLTLGGREGVRAYDDDAYPAARRLLATVEQRFPLPDLLRGLADLGGAVFVDAGAGWSGGAPFSVDSGLRAGAGVGLRMGVPAGGRGVLRIDVGFPLTARDGYRTVVFRASTELLGLLDRRSWPTQTDRSRWYGVDPSMTTRPVDPLSGN